MEISLPDQHLLDGENGIFDFREFEEVGISPSCLGLDGTRGSPNDICSEVLKDIFNSTSDEGFGNPADLVNGCPSTLPVSTQQNLPSYRTSHISLAENPKGTTLENTGSLRSAPKHPTRCDTLSYNTLDGDEEASSLLGENTDGEEQEHQTGDRREKRRRSNRESARRGRMRRMQQLGDLQKEVSELNQQHELLLSKLAEAGDLLDAASRENRIYKTIARYLGSDQPELMKALKEANAADGQRAQQMNEISDEEAEAIAAAALATNNNNPTKALMDLLNLAIQRNNMVV
uniref:BZIP domain-containing protein n=1 Tax=Tetraselmis sp. GSL018 TaxID=582737 RepID=A0A061RJS6_9CHLO|mmetsp:Transcript_37707/g.89556  ORF Transcript_37707/g.89556 Transcript_37707/m.89556 type:complete len:289 (-) Transcript_37707:361-1227(-)